MLMQVDDDDDDVECLCSATARGWFLLVLEARAEAPMNSRRVWVFPVLNGRCEGGVFHHAASDPCADHIASFT